MEQPKTVAQLMQSKEPSSNSLSLRSTAAVAVLPPQAIELRRQYGADPEALLTVFNPSKQIAYTKDVQRVHFGKAPALGVVAKAYGQEPAEGWLIIQLNDLAQFAGVKKKLSPRQIEETAQIIMRDYGHYNLAEIMLFLTRYKSGQYGEFFGAVDPMRILSALNTFDGERRYEHEKHEGQQRRLKQEQMRLEEQAIRDRYAARVPGAFGQHAPLSFLQYRLAGYDTLNDEEFEVELDKLISGAVEMPTDAIDILEYVNTAQP